MQMQLKVRSMRCNKIEGKLTDLLSYPYALMIPWGYIERLKCKCPLPTLRSLPLLAHDNIVGLNDPAPGLAIRRTARILSVS
jgi:hypothetical protein